jgi:hypothetical protein
MSATHRQRGTLVPGTVLWTAEEDELVRTLPTQEAVRRTERTLSWLCGAKSATKRCFTRSTDVTLMVGDVFSETARIMQGGLIPQVPTCESTVDVQIFPYGVIEK